VSYRPAPLREVLRPRAEFVTLDDFSSYRRVRVQLHGKGVVLRDDIEGTDIRTKKQQVVKGGDFLVAEIDAKVGGFGIVPPDLDGAIVSSHYFLFEVDETRCRRGWLDAFIRSGQLEEQVTARGSTNYAAIRPETVLGFQIPLPDPPEQKRIVARIEGLAGKIEGVRATREEVRHLIRGALLSKFEKLIDDAKWEPMAAVAPLTRRPITVEPDVEYHELGIRSYGNGTFHKAGLTGFDLGDKKMFRIEPGDVLFNIVFAWEGAVAVAGNDDKGRVASHRFLTCVPIPGRATAPFLRFYFLTPRGLEELGRASPGGAGRNRTLGVDSLARLTVPIVNYTKQLEFDQVHGKCGEIDEGARCSDREISKLMPAVLARAFSGQL
jgi:type I restriction enzyme S subunit